MYKYKQRNAQQLVEFLLVIPFMMIILGILTEYSYALNINMTLTHGLKYAASTVYRDIKPGMTHNKSETLNCDDNNNPPLEKNLCKYLSDNNVPTTTENNIKLGYVIVDNSAIFMLNYTYIPAFSLPNVWFHFMPDKFQFLSTAAVPSAFLKSSNYSSGIDSRALDNIWPGITDFQTTDGFEKAKKGIMKEDETTMGKGRSQMLFLVQSTVTALAKPFTLISWDGTPKTDTGGTYTLDLSNGKVYLCSSATACAENKDFMTYLSEKGYYNVIFDGEDPENIWLTPTGATDISAESSDGTLKRLLGLIDTSNLSIGNYDNIDTTFNTEVSTSILYKVKTLGSLVLVYPNEIKDEINSIASKASEASYNGTYNF